MNRHPVVENTIVFGTKPLQECVDIFKDRVANSDRGMMIHAPPKQGVSTVCRHIVSSMRSASTAVVVFAQAVQSDDLPVNRQADSLWSQLIPPNAAVKSYVRNVRDVLARYIEVEADRLQTKHVVFAVDQAENLSLYQWDALKILLENLRSQQKLSCFALLAGHSELLSLPRRMNRRLRHALVAEFFVGQCRLRGVSLDELPGVLEKYDIVRFPLPEGPTYTEHFCPSLWRRGMKLANYSDVMRDAFEKLLQTCGMGAKELGMEYVAAAVRRFLLGAESVVAQRSVELNFFAQTCVGKSGLRERLMLLGNPEAEAMDQGLAPRRGWQ